MARGPDDARHSTPSLAIAPSSSNPRSRVRAYPSPQYVPMRRQQSGFPFPRMSIGSTPSTPPAILPEAQGSIDPSRSMPDLQPSYVRYPSLHRRANRTRAAAEGGPGLARQPMNLPLDSSTRSLPSASTSSVSHARRSAVSPAKGAILGPPISKTASAPATVPLRAIAKQKSRINVSRHVPTVDWTKLPVPALRRVLAHLRELHLELRSRSCNTCYMRDLGALQRSCKAWSAAAYRNL